MRFNTIIEPFRIKTVEPIRQTTIEERRKAIKMAHDEGRALDEDYLKYRIRSIEYLGEKMLEAGVPIVTPTGGHALYLDARRMLPHIPQGQFPAWALSLVLYIRGMRIVDAPSVLRHFTARLEPADDVLVVPASRSSASTTL